MADDLAAIRNLLNQQGIRTVSGDGGGSDVEATEVLKQFGAGFIGGFTTFNFGDDPDNSIEGIARNIGHLMGFIGYVPGVGTVGKLASMGVVRSARAAAAMYGRKAVAESATRGAAIGIGKALAKAEPVVANFKSVPLTIADAAVNAMSRQARKAGLGATSKFLKEGALARDLIKGGVHLGIASAASVHQEAWKEGIDVMAGAFASGAFFGAGFRGIGAAMPHLTPSAQQVTSEGLTGASPRPDFATLFGRDGSQNQINFFARTLAGALFQGLPATLRDMPTEMQVYEYLMGAYFAGRELPHSTRQALEVQSQVYSAVGKNAAARVMLMPEKNMDGQNGRPLWQDLPTEVQHELRLQSDLMFGKMMGPEGSRLFKQLGMYEASETEIIFAGAVQKEALRQYQEAVKSGKSEEEAWQGIKEWYVKEPFGVRTNERGEILLDDYLAEGGKELSIKDATLEQLEQAKHLIATYDFTIESKGRILEPQKGKGLDVLEARVAKNKRLLEAIEDETRLRQTETAEETGELNRQAREALTEKGTETDLEKRARIARREGEALQIAADARRLIDYAERAAEVDQILQEHLIPDSIVNPIVRVARQLTDTVKDTAPEVAEHNLTKALLTEVGAARNLIKETGATPAAAYESFLSRVSTLAGKEIKGAAERDVRRAFLHSADVRKMRQLVILGNGGIVQRSDVEGGKRVDRYIRRSYLDDVIDDVRKSFGLDTTDDAHEFITRFQGEDVMASSHLKEPNKIVYRLINGDGSYRRILLGGEKEKSKLHVVPAVIPDPAEAHRYLQSYVQQLDAVRANNEAAWVAKYGTKTAEAIINEQRQEFANSFPDEPPQQIYDTFAIDVANRLVYYERIIGGGKLSLSEMVEANLQGRGSFVLDPVAVNKRIPIFATEEPRMDGSFLVNKKGKPLPGMNEDGTLNFVLTNHIPKSTGGALANGGKGRITMYRWNKGKVEEFVAESHMDGQIYLRSDIWDAYTRFAGRDPNTGSQKGYITHNDPDLGLLMVKPRMARAEGTLDKWMHENGVHANITTAAGKQIGLRRPVDMVYKDDGTPYLRNPETGGVLQKDIPLYKLAPEGFTTNLGVGSDFVKESKNAYLPVQVGKRLSSFVSGEDAVNSMVELSRRSIAGDEALSNEVLEAHLTGTLPKRDFDVDDVDLNVLYRILKGNDAADSPVYDLLARKILRLPEEDPDGFFDGESSQEVNESLQKYIEARSTAEQVISSGTKLTPIILESPVLRVQGLWDSTFSRYFRRRVTRPKMPNSGQFIARHYDGQMAIKFPNFSEGQFYANDDFGKTLKIRWRDDAEDVLLADAWGEFEKAGGWEGAPSWMKDRLEMFAIRIPADSRGAGRMLRFMGFTGERGTELMFHPKDHFYMGGMDLDIDKSFIFQNMPQSIKDAYRRSAHAFETKGKFNGRDVWAFKDLGKLIGEYASLPSRGSLSSHPLGIGLANSMVGTARQAYEGNSLLGTGLNAAARAKVFQEMEVGKGKNTITREVRFGYNDPVRDQFVALARQLFPKETDFKKFAVERIADIRRDNGQRIEEETYTVVNAAADSANFEKFYVNTRNVGERMIRSIETPGTERWVFSWIDASGRKVTRPVRLPDDMRQYADENLWRPYEVELMTNADRSLKGRGFNYERITVDQIVEDMYQTVSEDPRFFSNNSNPWYRLASEVSKMHGYQSRMRSPVGEAFPVLRKRMHDLFGGDLKKLSALAGRRVLTFPEPNYSRDTEAILLDNKRRIRVMEADMKEARRNGDKQLVADLQQRIAEAQNIADKIKRTEKSRFPDLDVQDAIDMASAEVLIEEGARALGYTVDDIAKLPAERIQELSKPLLAINRYVEEVTNAYYEMVTRQYEEAKPGEIVDKTKSIEQFRLHIDELLKIAGDKREYAYYSLLSSLRPQETILKEYEPYKIAKDALEKARKDKSSDAIIKGRELQVRQAKVDWYATNYSTMWAMADVVPTHITKKFFDTVNRYGSKAIKATNEEIINETILRSFGNSEILDSLRPNVNKLAEVSFAKDMASNTVVQLTRKTPMADRMRILAEFEGEIKDPDLLRMRDELEEIFKTNPIIMNELEAYFSGAVAERDAYTRGVTVEGMSKVDLQDFIGYMRDINTLRGKDLMGKLDSRRFSRFNWFYNPDTFDKGHLKFDAQVVTRARPVIGPDGRSIEMREVKSYISTMGTIHKIASAQMQRVSMDENRESQELAQDLHFLNAADKVGERDLLVRIAVGLREESFGTISAKIGARNARRDLSRLEKLGRTYTITETAVVDGQEVTKQTHLSPRQMVERVNEKVTAHMEKFYRRWIGDPDSESGLTKYDEQFIIWEDKENLVPDISKTMEKMTDAILRGQLPRQLSLNAIYRLTHRHMLNNIVQNRTMLTEQESNALWRFMSGFEGKEFVPYLKSGSFNYGIYNTDTYKAWSSGKLKAYIPPEVESALQKAKKGAQQVRLGDLPVAERLAAEADIMSTLEVINPRLANKLTYRPVGKVDFAAYWPHNGHPRRVLKQQKQEKIERLAKQGASAEEKLRAELEAEIEGSRMNDIDGNMSDDIANLFLFDTYRIADLEEVGGIGYRPGHSLSRSEGEPMPGYSTDMTAIRTYFKQMVKGNLQATMALMNSEQIRRFEDSNVAGEYTKAWARFMKSYNRDAMGMPTVFPNEWLSDPHLRIQQSPYWMFTDEYWVNRMKGKAKQYGFNGDITMTIGQRAFLAKRLARLSRLEGQYELLTLLSRTKSGLANIFGGSVNTWVQNGRESFLNARNLDYLQREINPNFKSMDDVLRFVERSGAIESFLVNDFQYSPRWDLQKDAPFVRDVKELFKKRPFEDNWDRVKDLADQHGVMDKVIDAGAFFMQRTERVLRRDSWLAGYIQARKVLKAGRADEVPLDHPWLLEMANRSVEASQYLYNNANRPAFARSSLGKIYSRFQIWGWKSIKMRRDIYAAAREAGYRPDTPEFDRMKRIMMADLFVVGLMKMFPFSIFDSSTPPPFSWMVDFADWAFGTKEDKESAFFGIGPTKIITPPAMRPLEDAFRLMMTDDWDRFFDYHLWTYAPFGLMIRDVKKTIESPITVAERLGGIPLLQLQEMASGKAEVPPIPRPGGNR